MPWNESAPCWQGCYQILEYLAGRSLPGLGGGREGCCSRQRIKKERETSDTVCFLMSGDLAKSGIVSLVSALVK